MNLIKTTPILMHKSKSLESDLRPQEQNEPSTLSAEALPVSIIPHEEAAPGLGPRPYYQNALEVLARLELLMDTKEMDVDSESDDLKTETGDEEPQLGAHEGRILDLSTHWDDIANKLLKGRELQLKLKLKPLRDLDGLSPEEQEKIIEEEIAVHMEIVAFCTGPNFINDQYGALRKTIWNMKRVASGSKDIKGMRKTYEKLRERDLNLEIEMLEQEVMKLKMEMERLEMDSERADLLQDLFMKYWEMKAKETF